MTLWLDAHLSPRLTRWIGETFEVECLHVRDLSLRHAEDPEIFQQARQAGAALMTKDEDFVRLVERHGPPPQVIWITAGNMPNASLRPLLQRTLPDALSLIASGEAVVEIQKSVDGSSSQWPG